MSDPFNWSAAMRFGFGVLRLSPRAFWSMTLRELEAAAQAHFVAPIEAPKRDWLEDAMARFPDDSPDITQSPEAVSTR
ncbi:MAG: phage tail assembly chaperone [Ahrensia sp.]|nr:phage tail assembly chaperone [Ahrensia sp.]